MQIQAIGSIQNRGGEALITLLPQYAPALTALEGFSHICVLWWAGGCDIPEARGITEVPKPYVGAPETMGIFATRSPARPNLIALSVAGVLSIDAEAGIVRLPWIDANDGTPLLDIKPYTPSADRVEAPRVPAWCAHWPKSLEASADFDWEAQFLF